MKRYPAYRDSGVEWLAEVPAEWDVLRLRRLARLLTEKTGRRVNPIGLENIESASGCFIETESDFEGDGVGFEAGDLLYGKLRPYLAKVGLATGPGEAVGDFHVLRPQERIIGRFLQYCLLTPSMISLLNGSTYGSKMPRVGWDFMANIELPVPHLLEQQAIAAFLDRETAKIDGLVAEQRRLVELLREKRQAVISHAVTRGLDPTSALKQSGIEWLGAVPEVWDILRLKNDLSFLTSGSRGWADHYSDDGPLFLRIGNLTRGSLRLDLSDIQRVSVPEGAEGQRTQVAPGDLLFSITAYLGSVAVVPEELEPAYVSQHVALARLKQRRLLPEWAGYVVLSSVGAGYFAAQGYGGTKIQLSLDDVANIIVPCPPIAEQAAICDYLDHVTAKTANLMATAETAIALLQERRAALISAAVTGQIDVRDAVAKMPATEAA